MTIWTTNDLVQIAAAGGGLDFDVGLRTTNDLVQIAAAASKGGGTLIMRNLKMPTTNGLTQIAAMGKGRVIFVLD